MRATTTLTLSACLVALFTGHEAVAEPDDGPAELQLHLGAAGAVVDGLVLDSVAPGGMGYFGFNGVFNSDGADDENPVAIAVSVEYARFAWQETEANGRARVASITTRVCVASWWGPVVLGGCSGNVVAPIAGDDEDVAFGMLLGPYLAVPFADNTFALRFAGAVNLFAPGEFLEIDSVGYEANLGVEYRFTLLP